MSTASGTAAGAVNETAIGPLSGDWFSSYPIGEAHCPDGSYVTGLRFFTGFYDVYFDEATLECSGLTGTTLVSLVGDPSRPLDQLRVTRCYGEDLGRGLSGFTGTTLDEVSLRCGSPTSALTTATAATTLAPGGGPQGPYDCPAGTALSGMSGTYQDSTDNRVLLALTGLCTEVNFGPPKLTLPSSVTTVASSASGATVTYIVLATDPDDGTVPVVCAPSSGSLFALGSTTVTCSATDSTGLAASGSFPVTVQYAWTGVLQPVNQDGTSVFKAGSTVPVKFSLRGASAGISTTAATLSFRQVNDSTSGPVNEAVTNVGATAGNLFRFDSGSRQYVFNWSTKGLARGRYELTIALGDGVVRTVQVSLR